MPKEVNKKMVLACSCGYTQGTEGTTLKEETKKAEEIQVVDESKENVNVIIDAECPKCGLGKAEYWEVQTRSSDEPPTRFHKCVKCRHTWREYS